MSLAEVQSAVWNHVGTYLLIYSSNGKKMVKGHSLNNFSTHQFKFVQPRPRLASEGHIWIPLIQSEAVSRPECCTLDLEFWSHGFRWGARLRDHDGSFPLVTFSGMSGRRIKYPVTNGCCITQDWTSMALSPSWSMATGLLLFVWGCFVNFCVLATFYFL